MNAFFIKFSNFEKLFFTAIVCLVDIVINIFMILLLRYF